MPFSSRVLTRAFTLLEICLVIVVLSVIAGLALPLMHGLIAQERIGGITNDYRDLALQARRLAVEEGIPYAIYFNDKTLTLAPWYGTEKRAGKPIDEMRIPPDMDISLRNISTGRWQVPAGQAWIFQTGGICDYLEIRTKAGSCRSELAFNPLTATARETAAHYE
ncbi:MAG: prepilin-type N-terminal cleavage/methylation domain-containing protein [Chthoniobacterales bacterium]